MFKLNLSLLFSNPVSQFVFIYLFVILTSLQSQKLNNTEFSKYLLHPFSYFIILFGINYSMNQSLLLSLGLSSVSTLIFYMFSMIEFMEHKLQYINDLPEVLPQYKNAKLSDIFKIFDNDINKLKSFLNENNFPDHWGLNDYSAPRIATYLYYSGIKV